MALLWVYYCHKMFCKNFDDHIRNKLQKMGVVMSCLPEYNIYFFFVWGSLRSHCDNSLEIEILQPWKLQLTVQGASLHTTVTVGTKLSQAPFYVCFCWCVQCCVFIKTWHLHYPWCSSITSNNYLSSVMRRGIQRFTSFHTLAPTNDSLFNSFIYLFYNKNSATHQELRPDL